LLFISTSPNLRINIRNEKTHYTPQGDVDHIDQPWFAQFGGAGNCPDFAREAAKGMPTFWHGIGQDQDPYMRISYFDTVQWQQETGASDADREFLEGRLITIETGDHMLVEMPTLAPPWPAYDKLTVQGRRTIDLVAEKIAGKISEDGYSPDDVAAYESANLNRPEVLAAIAALTSEDDAEPADVLIEA
jgi:hypothetical protein